MRVALYPINPTIGDLEGNASLIAASLDHARLNGADLAVFPELALCGYPPKDLLLQHGFIEACATKARELGERRTQGLTAVFGVPLASASPGRIANSLVAYGDNKFIDSYDKRLLPTYDVFDEDRYFEPGVREVILNIKGVRVGLSICEDLWKGQDAGFASHYAESPDPVAALASRGIDVLISPSASPFVVGKSSRHFDIVSAHAKRHSLLVASLNQLGGNDELVFDGHAFLCGADGRGAGAMPRWRGEPLLAEVIPATQSGPGAWRVLVQQSPAVQAGEASRHAFAPAHAAEDLYRALTLGIRDYLRKTGFKSAIIGLSGGIDSALTAVLACAAIGPANVLGVLLPSRFSSEDSRSDAAELADRLGMPRVTIPIEPAVEALRGAIDPAFRELGAATLGAALPDLSDENLQSRARGTIVMAISNRTGAIVLTTGNKSEMSVGYCTLYGDMNGGLAVLSDVSKMAVYDLSKWINANAASLGFKSPPIPQSSISKAPSAELRPNQTDQDSLPPYDVLDAVLAAYVEDRCSPAEIVGRTGADPALVAKLVRMIDLAEYKRKQAAIGLKVTSVAFGSGRRFPIAQRYRAQL